MNDANCTCDKLVFTTLRRVAGICLNLS